MDPMTKLFNHVGVLVEFVKVCLDLRPVAKSEEEYGQRINAYLKQHREEIEAAQKYFGRS